MSSFTDYERHHIHEYVYKKGDLYDKTEIDNKLLVLQNSTRSSVSLNLRVMLTMPYNKYRAISSLTLILRSLAGYDGYSCNAQ